MSPAASPRQNRVDPFGEIIAVPDRGVFMGNRGILPDEKHRLVVRPNTRRVPWDLLERSGLDSVANATTMQNFVTCKPCNKAYSRCDFQPYAQPSVQQCFQPAKSHLVLGTIADIPRSKSALIAENAFLRQPLIGLQRQPKRPALTRRDRTLLVLVASRFSARREALMVVKPDSLLGRHRQGFRLFWRHKSKARTPQPRVPEDGIALIHAMALDNRLWDAKRIRDELRKLGYPLTKYTIAKYIRENPVKRGAAF